MYRAIMVPLDGSPFSAQALPTAQALAQHTGAVLHLVQVHIPVVATYLTGVPAVDNASDAARRVAERVSLAGLSAQLGATTEVKTALLGGSVVSTLLEYAHEHCIDLIVMTTHGRGGFTRMWLGSVADTLLRQGPMPMLLLRASGAGTVQAPVQFRHIAVALDGSPEAETILDDALAFGSAWGASYTLVRVVTPFVRQGNTPELQVSALRQRAAERLGGARRYLDGIAKRLRHHACKVAVRVIIGEHPAQELLDDAQADGLDLIALATHGRGGVGRVLLGSTADKVIRGTTLPVLVRRPQPHLAPVDAVVQHAAASEGML